MVEDEINVALVTVPVQVKLKGREIPSMAPLAIQFDVNDLPADIEELTDIATGVINDKLDRKSVVNLIIEDDEHNKRIFVVDEIQEITVLTPTEYDPASYRDDDDD